MSKNGCGLINANGTRSETGKQGTSSFPAGLLYEKYNLYKVPTTACWKKVHALQKNIANPCAGKADARFDEGWQGETYSLLYPFTATSPFTPCRREGDKISNVVVQKDKRRELMKCRLNN